MKGLRYTSRDLRL